MRFSCCAQVCGVIYVALLLPTALAAACTHSLGRIGAGRPRLGLEAPAEKGRACAARLGNGADDAGRS
jgi:hypothetical protein